MRGKAELAILRVTAFSNSGQGTKADLALRVKGFRMYIRLGTRVRGDLGSKDGVTVYDP